MPLGGVRRESPRDQQPHAGLRAHATVSTLTSGVGTTRRQHAPPASMRKKASMSASVPTSPSPSKSAVLVQGAEGQLPAMQAKKASISESVPTSPSQLKSTEPQREPRPTKTL